MAKTTPDIEFTGIETLKALFRQFAVGSEDQERLLYQGVRVAGRVVIGETDDQGLAEMADLTMTAIAELLQSPDPADRVLALKLYDPIYGDIRKAKQTAAGLAEFYQRVGFTPGQD